MAAEDQQQTTKTSSGSKNKSSLCWQHRLFGKLIRCNQINNRQCGKPFDASTLLLDDDSQSNSEIIGIYFSFINSSGSCDEFTHQLVELYNQVNSIDSSKICEEVIYSKRKKFEIVHVVLWNDGTDVIDLDESFKNYVADLPWLAVCNRDYERKVN